MTKYLYIPMEIFDRELDGNLILSLRAIDRGWTVILGGKDILWRLETLPQGVYLLKSIVPGEIATQDRIHAVGSRVTCLDQEGLLQRWGLEYRFRFNEESINKTDLLFFWGREQRKHFQEVFPGHAIDKLVVTGSPRADFWALSGKNKERFLCHGSKRRTPTNGSYVLFATSFGNANHALGAYGQKNLLRSASNVELLGADYEKILSDNAESRRDLARRMIEIYKNILLSLSSTLPSTKIVLRPHPSEDIEFWRMVTAGRENISIEVEGSTTDWIVGAKCVIQYGSTVAIESAILGVPVVTCIPPLPIHLQELNLKYPEMVSQVATNVEDTVSLITGIVKDERPPEPVDLLVLQDITNSDQGFHSADRVLDALDRIAINSDQEIQIKGARFAYMKKLIPEIKGFILALAFLIPGVRSLAPERYRHLRIRKPYMHRKIYKMSVTGLVNRMNLINDVAELTDQPFSVEELSGNLFRISTKQR